MLNKISPEEVVAQANALKSDYDADALESMLEIALERLRQNDALTLSTRNTKELLNDILVYLGNTLERYRIFTARVFNTWITSSVIEYLVARKIISSGSDDEFIIYIIVAILMDVAFQMWKDSHES